MAVDHGRRGRFLYDGEGRGRHDVAGFDAVDVGRDGHDPMRIVADQIGLDAAARDRLGFLVRGTRRAQERDADFLEAVGVNRRHWFFLSCWRQL